MAPTLTTWWTMCSPPNSSSKNCSTIKFYNILLFFRSYFLANILLFYNFFLLICTYIQRYIYICSTMRGRIKGTDSSINSILRTVGNIYIEPAGNL